MSLAIDSIRYVVLMGTFLVLWRFYHSAYRRRLPPGPRPLPIIGNLRDFPTPGASEGSHWAKHKALYGPISSVQAFGKTYIIINDAQTAVQLLDKKSAIYSERPSSYFAGEMCGFADVVSLQCTTDKWRNARRRIHNYLGTRTAVSKFSELIELEARRLALSLLEKPDQFLQHFQMFAGAMILKMTYGYSASPDGPSQDPMVALGNKAALAFVGSVNNLWAVDVFPFLRHIPSWMPGGGFKRVAEESKRVVMAHLDLPVAFVKSELASGTAIESFVGHELEMASGDAAEELEIRWTGGALYGAGADTTVSVLDAFTLAMVLNPSVLQKAQREIDVVIGRDRLPTFPDLASLPYVEAVMKETLRWNTTLHLGLPHVALEDDTYGGYIIPKGSIVLANIWQMCNDPIHYPDPSVFNPDRFLEVSNPACDPRNLVFGFGRRICPGREFANSSMLMAMATMIATFNISNARNDHGIKEEALCEFTTVTGISHPKPFRCSFTPRLESAKLLVHSVAMENLYDLDDSKKIYV